MGPFFKQLIKNPLFKFASSIKLAVPLMATLGVVVAVGTLLESRYNAQVASIWIYQTLWFWVLIGILAANLLCAVLVRIPLRRDHTGFVITHIGLLTLIFGAWITATYGIDGMLAVPEGQTSNRIQLNHFAIQIFDNDGKTSSYPIQRELHEMNPRNLASLLPPSSGLVIDRFIPLGRREQRLVEGRPGDTGTDAYGIEFRIESQFFNVTESLHRNQKPEISMGPAHFRILEAQKGITQNRDLKIQNMKPPGSAKRKNSEGHGEKLKILNATDGGLLREINLSVSGKKNHPLITLDNREIKIIQILQSAIVDQGKLTERQGPGPRNPALELEINQEGKKFREVVFGLHPGFALNAQGVVGLKFLYEINQDPHELNLESKNSPQQEAASPPQNASGNLVEFRPISSDLIHVELFKNGKKVFTQDARIGEVLTTPWMGMKLTLLKVYPNGQLIDQVIEIPLPERAPLPPSAILVRARGAEARDALWVIEGEPARVPTPSGLKEIYYGPSEYPLPFTVHLDQFSKIDYLGTHTPMSYESKVRINDTGEAKVISMNEPLKQQGFTVYQSSFEMARDTQTVSIFSVNRDPGRPIKYAGSLILCLGIILFTGMRSRLGWLKRKRPTAAALFAALGLLLGGSQARAADLELATHPEVAQQKFLEVASQIPPTLIALPVQSHGRVKPLDTLARENLLYMMGKYSKWKLTPVQFYLGMIISNASSYIQAVNIRDPSLRVELGLDREDRYVSVERLGTTRLEILAKPLIERQEKNDRSLSPREKAILETAQQLWLARSIISGEQLFTALDLNPTEEPARGHGASATATQSIEEKLQGYLSALSRNSLDQALPLGNQLLELAKAQRVPSLFQRSMNTLDLEVSYNFLRPFFMVGIGYFILGLFLLVSRSQKPLPLRWLFLALSVPFTGHLVGFGVRVWITGFAPVTNMYGTMIWMAFGVVLFGSILFKLYRNQVVFGVLLMGASFTVLLAESIPLILSPDLDPVVAVLRSNLWLTIHVMTISISYAAFTIAMLIGNMALLRGTVKPIKTTEIAKLSHIAYRAIQLGIFLLTSGIILGGIWADYSWGRFWGWDPKETWALIADLGFIMLLHGRLVGWVTPFWLLALSPLAYLLVIMAWYGVNFILAAGLHSYGFSDGGAIAVASFVGLQLVVFFAAWIQAHRNRSG